MKKLHEIIVNRIRWYYIWTYYNNHKAEEDSAQEHHAQGGVLLASIPNASYQCGNYLDFNVTNSAYGRSILSGSF